MSSESALWQTMRKNVSPYGFFHRIENVAGLGTPDVAYAIRHPRPASGWIELKYLPRFPVRDSTPITISHLTLDQVCFAEGWTAAGGRAYLLLQIRTSFFLIDAPCIRGLYERRLGLVELTGQALLAATGFPTKRLIQCLTA